MTAKKKQKAALFTEGGFLAFPSGFEPLTYRLGVFISVRVYLQIDSF